MLKKIMIVLLLLCLCACSNTAPQPDNNTKDDSDPKPETVQSQKPLTDDYLSKMNDSEFLHVALLGISSSELSVDDILNRAKTEWGYSLIEEISKEDIVYGPQLGDNNLVYLYIPKNDVDVKVWKIDLEKDLKDGPVYEGGNAVPFIYVEKEKGMDPISMITFDHQNEEGFMYSGLNYQKATLRAPENKGVVDITPYDNIHGGERPFYAQGIFDKLCYDSDYISNDLMNNGYMLDYVEEAVIDGRMYLIFKVSDGSDGSLKYNLAVNYDNDMMMYRLLQNNGNGNWFDPNNAAG